jgi:Fe-S-cluster containining protein
MKTDLVRIQKIAKEKEDENWKFRTFLKCYEGKKIDSIVHRLFKKISDEIDCTTCGNCCKRIQPVLKDKDITKLSESLKIDPKKFKDKYVGNDEDGDRVLKQIPCSFLNDNKCTQYEYRPLDCVSYPHLHKKDFVYRLIGVINNYSVCPIVFNVYEELKSILKSDFEEYKDNYDEFDFF